MNEQRRALTVHIKAGPDGSRLFFPVLRKGFKARGKIGSSIKKFLCHDDRGWTTGEYLEKRIQTIFLDGKPVDNPDSVRLRDGAKLALSSAMPGAAGAIFRKKGAYAPMRDANLQA